MKLILLFFIPYLLIAQDKYYDGRLYFTDKTSLTMSWDPVANATFYEAKEAWYDANIEYDLGSTTTTSITLNKRRSGHFRYFVRSCMYDVNNNKLCSDWADSLNIDYATVDGVKGRWLVYWRLAPPGPPVIQ
jgi:hypothetical protein